METLKTYIGNSLTNNTGCDITAIDSGVPIKGWDLTLGESFSWSITFKDVPILFSISEVSKSNKKAVIHYTSPKNYNLGEFQQGSLYIGEKGIVTIFNCGDNHYWNNTIIVTGESAEEIDKISKGDLFGVLNQWDKKISNEDIVKSIKDPHYYYNLVHSVIENGNSLYKLEAHKKIDELMDLKDYE